AGAVFRARHRSKHHPPIPWRSNANGWPKSWKTLHRPVIGPVPSAYNPLPDLRLAVLSEPLRAGGTDGAIVRAILVYDRAAGSAGRFSLGSSQAAVKDQHPKFSTSRGIVSGATLNRAGGTPQDDVPSFELRRNQSGGYSNRDKTRHRWRPKRIASQRRRTVPLLTLGKTPFSRSKGWAQVAVHCPSFWRKQNDW